ncbi:MAG: hypothetical protein ACI4HQ_13955 [Acetatifactor sp.]
MAHAFSENVEKLSELRLANRLANMPVLDSVVEVLIEKGLLTPPEDGKLF